jgi:hypothetical protein
VNDVYLIRMSKTTLGTSQFGGQGLFSTTTTNGKFEPVLREKPFVVCLMQSALKTTCSFCWSKPSKPLRCAQCKNAVFCSAVCQKAAWQLHLHKGECTVAADRVEDSVRLCLRFLFRGEPSRPLGDVAALLSPAERQHFSDLARVLAARLVARGHGSFDEEKVERALLQLHCCGMRVPDPADGSPMACALYATASAAMHSCRPSCFALFDAQGVLSLVTTGPVEKGQELSLSYIDERAPRLLRQFQLYDTWRINRCRCAECEEAEQEKMPRSPSLLFDLFEAKTTKKMSRGKIVC